MKIVHEYLIVPFRSSQSLDLQWLKDKIVGMSLQYLSEFVDPLILAFQSVGLTIIF